MSEKNLKQEDCTTLTAKATRVHTPASIHQMPQANVSIIAPPQGAGGTFPIPPDVVSSHIQYRMLPPPSFPHPLASLSAPLTGPNARTGHNDLGPPIFMPPLNLGTPKSTPPTSTSANNKQSHIVPSSSPVTPTMATPSSLHSHMDSTTSPNVINSYPNMIAPSGPASFHHLHSTKQPYPKTQSKPPTSQGQNPIRKTLLDQQDGKTKTHPLLHSNTNLPIGMVKNAKYPCTVSSPVGGYPMNNVISQNAGLSMGPGKGMGMEHMKQSIKPSTISGSEIPSGFVPSGHYQPNMSKVGLKEPVTKFDMSEGQGLVCTEGLPPPVPRNTISSTAICAPGTDSKHDRLYSTNHISESHFSGTSLQNMTVSDSQIPWPEAVSKNIIIPAPNLTGKDIANLTSASSSPIATNERTGGNDITWVPPLSDNNLDNHHSMSPMETSGSHTVNAGQSHDSSLYPQTVSNSISMGMSLVSQSTTASPRPSILRKRGYDGRPADVLSSPSSPGIQKLLRQRSRGSPSIEHINAENHYNIRDDISSPRKRPRKQHLNIDSINDRHFPAYNQQDVCGVGDSSLITGSNIGPGRNSLLVNDRLSGSLPPKDKFHNNSTTTDKMSRNDKQDKTPPNDMLYISQLRRPQYPLVQLCRRNRRTARNHFRRYADIKHKEDDSVSPSELCSQSSTWIRSSGWKLQHFRTQLENIEKCEDDVLSVMERLQSKCEKLFSEMPEEELEEKHRMFLREKMMSNIERVKRSRLHVQETRENMMKVLDVNSKVVDIMRKFAGSFPTKLLLTTTSVTDLDSTST